MKFGKLHLLGPAKRIQPPGFREALAAYNFADPMSLFNENGELADLGWEGEDIYDGFTSLDAGWTDNGDDTFTNDGVANGFIRSTDPIMLNNIKYKVTITVSGMTTGSVSFPYPGSGAVYIPANGTYERTFLNTFGNNKMHIYGKDGFDGTVSVIIAIPVGDTVAKVLDVGSGGVDRLTYYNLTQSDLSLQPKRVAGGLEFDGVDDNFLVGSGIGVGGATKLSIVAKLTIETGKSFFFSNNEITGDDRVGLLYTGDSLYLVLGDGSTGDYIWGTIGSLSGIDNKVVVGIYDGTQTGNADRCKIYIDGVQQTLSFRNTIPAQLTTVDNDWGFSYNGVASLSECVCAYAKVVLSIVDVNNYS